MSRKTLLIIKLALYIFLFLLVLALSAQILWKGWSPMTFSGSGKLVSSEHFTDVTSVQIGASSYSIEVTEHDDPDTIVSFYRVGLGSAAEPDVILENGTLQISEQGVIIGLHLGGGRIVVQVPRGSKLPYALSSVSGSIHLDAVSTTAKLHSISGSLKAYQAGGKLIADTTSGSIKLYKPFVSIDAQSTSGSIKAAANAETEKMLARSVSGSVKLALRDVPGYQLTYRSVSGSVKDEYHGISYGKSGSAPWGDGSLVIDAKTTSGSIKLTDWDD